MLVESAVKCKGLDQFEQTKLAVSKSKKETKSRYLIYTASILNLFTFTQRRQTKQNPQTNDWRNKVHNLK